jgi:hypothetical protein
MKPMNSHILLPSERKTMAATVIDFLKREKRALTKDELLEKWTRIGAENRQRLNPAYLAEDYDSEMYDDWGLPK